MKYSKPQASAEDIQDLINKALFGTEHIGKLYACVMVTISLICAMFIPHDGFFATSQSVGMSNYHRWLYDVFVITSCVMGCMVYLRLQHKKQDLKFRRLWFSATKLIAEARFREYQYAQSQHKSTIMYSSKIIFYMVMLVMSVGVVAMYIWMTPYTGTYKSTFWILSWWPINAVIIWTFYCCQIYLFLRLYSTEDMHKHFQRMQAKAKRQEQKSLIQQEEA